MTDDKWDPGAPAAINQAAGENNRAPTEEQKERMRGWRTKKMTEIWQLKKAKMMLRLVLKVTLISGS